MTTTHDRSSTSREIEQEADARRAQLSETLDELRDMLTPGRIAEELFSYARDSGASLLRNLGNAAVQNPVPTLLIGAGCAMLLSGSGRRNYRPEHWAGENEHSRGAPAGPLRRAGSAAGDGFGRVARGVAEGMGQAARGVSSAAAAATANIRDAASGAAQTTASLAGEVKERAASFGETVADAAGELREGAAGIGAGVQEYSKSAADYSRSVGARAGAEAARVGSQIKERASSFLEEQPVIVAAIGVALGAAIGAALPSTETEDRLLGESSDAVKTQAGAIASQSYETGRSILKETLEEAKSAAAAEGLTAEKAVETARELGDKVRNVASEVSGSLQAELEGRPPARSIEGNR